MVRRSAGDVDSSDHSDDLSRYGVLVDVNVSSPNPGSRTTSVRLPVPQVGLSYTQSGCHRIS